MLPLKFNNFEVVQLHDFIVIMNKKTSNPFSKTCNTPAEVLDPPLLLVGNCTRLYIFSLVLDPERGQELMGEVGGRRGYLQILNKTKSKRYTQSLGKQTRKMMHRYMYLPRSKIHPECFF
jgi:hypothetical protein